MAVAENPGKSYNPLTIYGESGLGKTHLLHALGHYIRDYFDRVRVRYVSTEELTNDFINAISQNRGADFRRRYRDVDVLLIDDIQFLEGKEQTQEEFFHTFNTLHNAQKQIVMTSDRPPKNLENLEPRLRSRFGWGLITDVQPPDLETRIAILRKKAAAERLVAGPEVLEFIASKIQTNIRELEGALIRVTAFASLNRQQVDMALAEVVLKDLIPEGGEAEISSSLIMAQTAAYFDLTIDDLSGQSRTHQLVLARQIAMYLCRELTELSLPKIGQQFGGRDHTTVMHADRKIRTLMARTAQRLQPGHRADQPHQAAGLPALGCPVTLGSARARSRSARHALSDDRSDTIFRAARERPQAPASPRPAMTTCDGAVTTSPHLGMELWTTRPGGAFGWGSFGAGSRVGAARSADPPRVVFGRAQLGEQGRCRRLARARLPAVHRVHSSYDYDEKLAISLKV